MAEIEVQQMDRLGMMFELQRILQKRILGVDLPAVLPERLPMTVTSIVAELGEILEGEQRWKDWRHDFPDVDRDHLRMEVADLWHFIINLTMYCGFDADDICREFVDKNQENHNRQNRGY